MDDTTFSLEPFLLNTIILAIIIAFVEIGIAITRLTPMEFYAKIITLSNLRRDMNEDR